MAPGADIGRMAIVVRGDPHSQGSHQAHPGGKGLPDPLDDPQDQRCDLHNIHDNADAEHDPVDLSKFFPVFHSVSYITDGFDREMLHTFQFPGQPLQPLQLFLALPDLPAERLLLLVQQNGDHAARVLFGQKLADAVDRQAQLPQEADDPQPFQVVVGVQPPASLAQLAGDQDAPGVVILHRPDGNAAELRHFSGRVFGHSFHLLPPILPHDAASQATPDAGGFLKFQKQKPYRGSLYGFCISL